MKMRYLIMPTKNVSLGQSILGISSIIYNIVKQNNQSVDEVYDSIKYNYINTGKLKYNIDFNQYILGLCFLYTINKINVKKDGVIYCEIN